MASAFFLKDVQKRYEYPMFIFSLLAVLQTERVLCWGRYPQALLQRLKFLSAPLVRVSRGNVTEPSTKQICYFFTVTMYFLLKQTEGFTSNV